MENNTIGAYNLGMRRQDSNENNFLGKVYIFNNYKCKSKFCHY